MSIVMSEPPLRRPYIPMGCDQQGHVTPTKLCEAHLDRQIAAKLETRSLPELLIAKGAMEAPPVTRWTLAARRIHRALLAVLAPRNHKERT